MTDIIQISDSEYSIISRLVYERFGINLGDKKRSLVTGRLQKIVKQRGFKNFKQYYDYLLKDTTGEALRIFIDRISTNHTFFYREQSHYHFYHQNVLPELITRINRRRTDWLRIWSAGCSSGEEPYTLAMLLLEFFGEKTPNTRPQILATDISTSALEKAEEGIYTEENVQHLPKSLKYKYLTHSKNGTWEIMPEVKALVLFRRLNLMRNEYPFKHRFHVVFCRNVMIYFDKPTREKLVHRFLKYMEPGGYLFIGHSESLGRSDDILHYVQPAVYRKRG